MPEEKRAFRVGLSNIVPVIFTLVLALGFTFLLGASRIEIVLLTVFVDGGGEAVLNALLFVSAMAVVGLLVYLLVRRRAWRLLRLVTAASFTLVTLMLSYLYLSSILDVAGRDVGFLVYVPSLLATAFVVYSVFISEGWTRNPVVLVFGAGLGAFLGASIPAPTGVFLLVFLAVYDIFAVYKGPVGKIVVEADPDKIRGLSLVLKNVQMGLGDLVFYSMLVSEMVLSYGLVSGLLSMLGVTIGACLGFKVLERRQVFPGLPLSLAFGLALGFLAALI
jgi:presenilin-like A22 family membrane protease